MPPPSCFPSRVSRHRVAFRCHSKQRPCLNRQSQRRCLPRRPHELRPKRARWSCSGTSNNITGTSGIFDQAEKGHNIAQDDVIWIGWDETDPGNPYNWGTGRKWLTTWICCVYTLVVAFCGAAFSMGTESMMRDLNCSLELAVVALSTFPLGFGLAPLVLAPFSDLWTMQVLPRMLFDVAPKLWLFTVLRFPNNSTDPMYAISAIVYTLFFLPITLGRNIATVIIARFIGGLAASTGSTLVGGTVADLFESKDRGLPMSIFSLAAFAGTGLGPATMGYVEENLRLQWRWISWIQLIIAGVTSLCIILLTQETRGSVILSKRAAAKRKETGDPRYQCRSDAERASLAILIKISLTRPLFLLFTEPIVAAFSLWVSFAWGILYLTLRAVPLVFANVYGFTIGQVGLVFYGVVVAGLLGFVSNFYQERLYQRHVATRGPEARLYAALIGGMIFPIGTFIFAFTQGRTHWMGPVIGLMLCFFGIFTIYLSTFNYLADAYTIYASSALSAQSLCRNLLGFAFPLFTSQLYSSLGYQWASFLSGMLGLALAVTPWVLFFFGPRIRASSKFAKELAKMRATDK
ncbi:BZ3500_MvSof-1268-A1-R1_Chr1-3g02242 [Microbotryum saponariae]|uniref:BZ3500_MvSof-1268-A1-R1_Chr1-3g02242 protein n=1 Tax=Microbotryum saponariae TaxID=289078 RepID=A0A2X0KCZ1_9BASI|nr:BZ3500_MvSof-1268-A1-R1_Chr1-3g02242 [Microbotryum saponariae]SCZ95754.1 BZ3501_MvSof-1269-A2-R1_Chr1-3g01845 [Microbotryum saponariae]